MKYWFPPTLAILALLCASLALAEDFKTVNGKEYKDATVSHVEADGIVLRTKSGITKVYFTELPKEVQERFHYDAPKAVSSAAPQQPRFTYVGLQDKTGRGTEWKEAQVSSSNTVYFGFPYEIHAWLHLRNSPRSEQAIMFRVEPGQFVPAHTKDFVTVRFDDGELQKFTIGDPKDGTSNRRFIHDNGTFINQLRQAKSLKIEADFNEERLASVRVRRRGAGLEGVIPKVKYWEIIADNLKKAGFSLGWVSALDVEGRTIWIVDAHGYGKRFIVRADEKLTAFLELESAIHEFAMSLIL